MRSTKTLSIRPIASDFYVEVNEPRVIKNGMIKLPAFPSIVSGGIALTRSRGGCYP